MWIYLLRAPPAGLPAAALTMFSHLSQSLVGVQVPPDPAQYTHLHPDLSARLAALRCGHILGDCLLPECSSTICMHCTTIESNLNGPVGVAGFLLFDLPPDTCHCPPSAIRLDLLHAVACLAYPVLEPEAHVAVWKALLSGQGLGS